MDENKRSRSGWHLVIRHQELLDKAPAVVEHDFGR